MRKLVLLILGGFIYSSVFGQENYWSSAVESRSITADKSVTRQSFPKDFKLFTLNIDPLRKELFSIKEKKISHSTIISLPNANGDIEQFELFEASNFEPDLQAQFPEIRAYSGKGISDKYATLKLSISPQGIQAMVFRTDEENEFIEPYSKDHTVYAVFKSQRNQGQLPWLCTTEDKKTFAEIGLEISNSLRTGSSDGQLKTFRLALSCNGEYSNFFGATSVAQVGLVLAAFNATLARCNGVFEKDLAVHLNLIAATTSVIFYDAVTDPYTTLGNWNFQLQSTLSSIILETNYDIGHMFGASGGGGNAGCIGCVCIDGLKGSGITSPADGIPQGDNFDIDYVVHEIGHQLGANHTFSFQSEGSTNVQKEVGSGITIMGYAGITSQDVAPHSIDIFHQASIAQIEANLAAKPCAISTNISANNATPVVVPLSNFTIPISTPFALTGSATDANGGDVLTYCWEQNDNLVSGGTGSNSVASPTKVGGPNWLSFSPSLSPTRYFPRLSSIFAGAFTTGPLPGGDAIATIEALSAVSRTLNFRLTVRDNSPYSSTPPIKVGQTAFKDMIVTVTNSSGPFQVTAPNTSVSWTTGSSQTVIWAVNNTTAAPVSCANVNILLSTDGGLTFPTVLIANTPNDGTENITVPSVATTTARIKVEAVGNIFFDINDINFTISTIGFTLNNSTPASAACPAPVSMQTTLTATYIGTFTNPITLSATGNPPGTNVVFGNNPLTPGSPSSTVTLNGTSSLFTNTYPITITGTASGAATKTQDISYIINPGAGPAITLQPLSQSVCQGAGITLTTAATGATSIQWQKSTNGGTTYSNISGATATSFSISSIQLSDAALYRVAFSGQCGSSVSSPATITVRQLPTVGLLIPPGNYNALLPGQTTTLLASPSVSTGGTVTTTWFLNGTAITNTNNTLAANVEQVGDYQVKIQESWPGGPVCSNQSPIVTLTATVSSRLFIFASPNDGRFTVSYYNNGGSNTKRKISIYNSNGVQVYNREFSITGLYSLINIDLRTSNRGIYYVLVGDASGKKLATGKVHIR